MFGLPKVSPNAAAVGIMASSMILASLFLAFVVAVSLPQAAPRSVAVYSMPETPSPSAYDDFQDTQEAIQNTRIATLFATSPASTATPPPTNTRQPTATPEIIPVTPTATLPFPTPQPITTLPPATVAPSPTPTQVCYRISPETAFRGVIVRSLPNTDGAIITKLPAGTVVEVTQERTGQGYVWGFVPQYNGWMAGLGTWLEDWPCGQASNIGMFGSNATPTAATDCESHAAVLSCPSDGGAWEPTPNIWPRWVPR